MTPDEAKAVLAAARESAAYTQWTDVDHLLRQVYDDQLLQGTDQGDAAYLLGVAYINLQGWDAAQYMLTEATTTAGHEYQAEARKRLAEITRHDTAVDDASDGVVQKEAADVLAAADDALARGSYDEARTWYDDVYNGHTDAEPRARAALGIATTYAHQQDLTQATQYAKYAVDSGVHSVAAPAHDLLAWITQQQGAENAAADGTTVDEFRQASEAAVAAFFAQDHARAKALFDSIADAPQVATHDRAKASFNAGLADRFLGLDTEARPRFEFAAANGSTELEQKARRHLDALDRHDGAEGLVQELAET